MLAARMKRGSRPTLSGAGEGARHRPARIRAHRDVQIDDDPAVIAERVCETLED